MSIAEELRARLPVHLTQLYAGQTPMCLERIVAVASYACRPGSVPASTARGMSGTSF